MSILTPIFGFIKSQTGDNIGKTIGEDLPANWDKVETEINVNREQINDLVVESDVKIIIEPLTQTTKTTVVFPFKPKFIHIKGNVLNQIYDSDGFATKSVQTVQYTNGNNTKGSVSGDVIRFREDSFNVIAGVVTFLQNGIEINWNVTGTVQGTERRLIISAIGQGI